MILPNLQANPKKGLGSIYRDVKIDFRGLNHNLYVGENEFWWMENLCATNYPVMTPRAARGLVEQIPDAQGLYARGKLMWAANERLYYGGEEVGAVSRGAKTFVGLGAYIVIFPDGLRYHTINGTLEPLTAAWRQTAEASVDLARLDGSDIGHVTISDTAPASPSAGDWWIDTSGDEDVMRVYSAVEDKWNAVPTTYARITSTGLGAAFNTGDCIQITGGTDEINGYHVIEAKTDDSITISCVLKHCTTVARGMKANRGLPQMDFVCELNNRIWGCSSAAHEIYCCKLGDPTNWYVLGTNAADAWAATVGSDGDFTGCCSFGGSVLFFKENILHKVFGTKPGNFQIQDTPLRGVMAGCAKSLCVVNESLIYKAREGVMLFDGGNPTGISDGLGTGLYSDAAAGADGDRYYISMRDEDGAWHMFVFNEAKGMWHREDNTHATDFASLHGQLYFLREDGALMAVQGRREPGAAVEYEFDWWAETGDMLIDQPDNKYLSRIQVKASVDHKSRLMIEAQYDSDGEWHVLYRRGGSRKSAFTIPLIPRRCDHLRLRISGWGRAAVYAISKEIEKGSEL